MDLLAKTMSKFLGGQLAGENTLKIRTRKTVFGTVIPRLANFAFALEAIREVPGELVECGVGSGGSFAIITKLRNVWCPERAVIGFDSFCGFPPDAHVAGKEVAGSGINQYDMVTENLSYAGIDVEKDNIRLVEGFFSETLPRVKDLKIAFLHIDVDLGHSYTEVLSYLYPLVSQNGLVMFDEYDEETSLIKWPDAKPAIDAFLMDKDIEFIYNDNLTRMIVRKLDQWPFDGALASEDWGKPS